MKKLLILLFLFAFIEGAQAQVNKGSFVTTGSFGYHVSSKRTTDNSSNSKTQRYLLSPKVGFLISDRLELGFFAYLNKSETHVKNHVSTDSTMHGDQEATEKAIGGYLRKYFFITEKLAFTGIGEASYNTYHRKSDSYNNQNGTVHNLTGSTIETSYFVVAVRPGLSFFLSDRTSLNTTFGELSYTVHSYDYIQHQDVENKEDTNKLGLNLTSTSFSLGLSYLF